MQIFAYLRVVAYLLLLCMLCYVQCACICICFHASAFAPTFMLMHVADAIYQPVSIDRHKHFDEQINSKTQFRLLKSSFDRLLFVETLSRVLLVGWGCGGWVVVVKTFKNSIAERVQPAPIYLRYIRIPFQINCRASAERVQPGPIYWRYISTFIVNAVQKQKQKTLLRLSDYP